MEWGVEKDYVREEMGSFTGLFRVMEEGRGGVLKVPGVGGEGLLGKGTLGWGGGRDEAEEV